jgi:hypothetical protein
MEALEEGRHLSSDIIVQKILGIGYWWPTMNQDIHEYCRTYDQHQKISNLLTQNLAKLVIILPKEPFKKWGLDFIRFLKLISIMSSNRYNMVATDHATKWVEAQTICTNIVAMIAQFLYEHILIRFGCPLTIVTNQGTHFISDAIMYLIDHFIMRHTRSIIYYPQGNGKAEFTNKVFGTLLTKLINENRNDWDEHLSIALFSY